PYSPRMSNCTDPPTRSVSAAGVRITRATGLTTNGWTGSSPHAVKNKQIDARNRNIGGTPTDRFGHNAPNGLQLKGACFDSRRGTQRSSTFPKRIQPATSRQHHSTLLG